MANIWDDTSSNIIRPAPIDPTLARASADLANQTQAEREASQNGVQDMAAASLALKYGGKPSDYLGLTAADLAAKLGGVPTDYKASVPMGTIIPNTQASSGRSSGIQLDADQGVSDTLKQNEPPKIITETPSSTLPGGRSSGIQLDSDQTISDQIKQGTANLPEVIGSGRSAGIQYDADQRTSDVIKGIKDDEASASLRNFNNTLDKINAVIGVDAAAITAREQENRDLGIKTNVGQLTYDIVSLLQSGKVTERDIATVFGKEATDSAKDQISALAAVDKYKTSDGGYNLVAARLDGVSEETIKKAGFNAEDWDNADIFKDRKPTYAEFSAYYGSVLGAGTSAKQKDSIYNEYVKRYGFGNFVSGVWQEFAIETIPAARAARADVTVKDIKASEWAMSALNLWMLAGAPGSSSIIKAATKGVSKASFEASSAIAAKAAESGSSKIVQAVAKVVGNPEGAKVIKAAQTVGKSPTLPNIIKFNESLSTFKGFSRAQLEVIETRGKLPGIANSVKQINNAQSSLSKELTKLNKLVQKSSPAYAKQAEKVLKANTKLTQAFRNYERVLTPDMRKVTIKINGYKEKLSELPTERLTKVEPINKPLKTIRSTKEVSKVTSEEYVDAAGRKRVRYRSKGEDEIYTTPTERARSGGTKYREPPEYPSKGGVSKEFAVETGEPPPSFARITTKTRPGAKTRSGSGQKTYELTPTKKTSTSGIVGAVGIIASSARSNPKGIEVASPSTGQNSSPVSITVGKTSSNTDNSTSTKTDTGTSPGESSSTKTDTETKTTTKTDTQTDTKTNSKTSVKVATRVRDNIRVKVPLREKGKSKDDRIVAQAGDVIWRQGAFWITKRNKETFYTRYAPDGMDNIKGTPDQTVSVRGKPPQESLPMGVVSVNINPQADEVLDFNSKPPRNISPGIPRKVRRELGM